MSEDPPLAVQNCSVPCKHQCPVSVWSSWSACLYDNCKDAEGKKGMRYTKQCLGAMLVINIKKIILLFVMLLLVNATTASFDVSVRLQYLLCVNGCFSLSDLYQVYSNSNFRCSNSLSCYDMPL